MSAIALYFVKFVLEKLLKLVVKIFRWPKKDETEEMAEREDRLSIEHICKIVFHTAAAVYAFMVMRGRLWVPWYLGGADGH